MQDVLAQSAGQRELAGSVEPDTELPPLRRAWRDAGPVWNEVRPQRVLEGTGDDGSEEGPRPSAPPKLRAD